MSPTPGASSCTPRAWRGPQVGCAVRKAEFITAPNPFVLLHLICLLSKQMTLIMRVDNEISRLFMPCSRSSLIGRWLLSSSYDIIHPAVLSSRRSAPVTAEEPQRNSTLMYMGGGWGECLMEATESTLDFFSPLTGWVSLIAVPEDPGTIRTEGREHRKINSFTVSTMKTHLEQTFERQWHS